MIVENGLALKRRPNLLSMSILFITDGLAAEFVVQCILGWEAGINEAVPGIHGLVGRDLLAEKDNQLIGRRLGDLST